MAKTHAVLPAESGGKRRRGEALQRAIFEAVFDQINEIGYARLTMDRVASAAGTGKAVLYRRWESKEALVLEALRDSLPVIADVPDGGNLRDDLLGVLGALRDAFAVTKGTAFHVVAAETGPDCRQLADERLFRPARQVILGILRRAAKRGQIRAEAVTELIADVGPALLRSRAIDGSIPEPAMVTAVVDEVLLPLLGAQSPAS